MIDSVMKPPSMSAIEELSLKETLENFQKSIDMWMSDDEEGKRSGTTDGTGHGHESIPGQTDPNAPPPPSPSPAIESGERNSVVFGSVNPGVSGNEKIFMVAVMLVRNWAQ